MNAIAAVPEDFRSRSRPAWLTNLGSVENWLIAAALGALTLLPLGEALLRQTVHGGIPGYASFEQHLTLVIGMLGGAIAARQGRLLALSTLGNVLPGRWRDWAGVAAAAGCFTISAALALAGWRFTIADRESQSMIVAGFPAWWVELILPAGFALIAGRSLLLAHGLRDRLIAVAGAALAIVIALWPPVSPELLVWPAMGLLAISALAGLPAFAVMGGAALILFWGGGRPIASVAIDHYSLVVNPSLPTLPLFTLAGYLVAEGGAPRRLIRLFRALLGQFPGGSAVVTAVVCAVFTAFTGASGVTIIALGGLLMPLLMAERYSERAALGMVTGAGSLGLLFPPCLPLILYAIVANVPMEKMFLGGIVPGMVMLMAVIGWGIWSRPRGQGNAASFDAREARAALWEVRWDLLLPVVASVALFGGWATPVEAAALTAFYAFFSQVVLYRDLSIRRDLPRVMAECGLVVGGVLLILGVSLGLTNYLVEIQVAQRAAEWTTSTIRSPWVFLLLLNLFLLLVGCLMDIYSAIIVQAPLLAPIAAAYGLDPVHVGIIFLANLELGYLTPPVGLNLFLSSFRFNKPLGEVLRAVAPIILVLLAGVLLITYVPWLTTALPAFVHSGAGE